MKGTFFSLARLEENAVIPGCPTIDRKKQWEPLVQSAATHNTRWPLEEGKLQDYLWDWELTYEDRTSMRTLKTTECSAGNLAWRENRED